MRFVEDNIANVESDTRFSNFLGVFLSLVEKNYEMNKLALKENLLKKIIKILEGGNDFWTSLMLIRLIRFSTASSNETIQKKLKEMLASITKKIPELTLGELQGTLCDNYYKIDQPGMNQWFVSGFSYVLENGYDRDCYTASEICEVLVNQKLTKDLFDLLYNSISTLLKVNRLSHHLVKALMTLLFKAMAASRKNKSDF